MTARLTVLERDSIALLLSILLHFSFIAVIPMPRGSTHSVPVPIEIQIVTSDQPREVAPVSISSSPAVSKAEAVPKATSLGPLPQKEQERMMPPLVFLPIGEPSQGTLPSQDTGESDRPTSDDISIPAGGGVPSDGSLSDRISSYSSGESGGTIQRPEFTPLIKVTKMPSFKEQVTPIYPVIAKRFEKDGTVIVEVSITETGRVLETKIVQGVGFGLDEAAQEAMKKSTFEPAYVGDRAVAVVVRIPIKFRFRD